MRRLTALTSYPGNRTASGRLGQIVDTAAAVDALLRALVPPRYLGERMTVMATPP
ncbi:MAG TPA: hypothetical protein VK817_24930 [Trebonia sp.]|jgi:hypothetical protein|nr:hypothetical protein [Trebonia sp.]